MWTSLHCCFKQVLLAQHQSTFSKHKYYLAHYSANSNWMHTRPRIFWSQALRARHKRVLCLHSAQHSSVLYIAPDMPTVRHKSRSRDSSESLANSDIQRLSRTLIYIYGLPAHCTALGLCREAIQRISKNKHGRLFDGIYYPFAQRLIIDVQNKN